MKYEKFHLQLIDKLGWGDMLAEIAIPAIDSILSNYIGNIAEATGDVLDSELAASCLIDKWDGDHIFGLLAATSSRFYGSEDEKLFISLRNEIEYLMRNDEPHELAIAEWWK